jgi:hypothetical protein
MANAYGPIRMNREFDSNEIDESDSQPRKHDEPRTSISAVIRTADDVEK